jgi:uncharacterized sulfatase
MFPQLLRESGYYTTNNSKEDYNLPHTGKVWDQSNAKAHWRGRAPGQPFFAVFNQTGTHESQIRTRPHEWKHPLEGVRIPAYHPDRVEVRQDWAQYYDNIEAMDRWAGGLLKQLADDGLMEDTIVFFYSDHGSGMPRGKRWPYDSGLRVPLIVVIPEKFRSLRPPEYKAGAATTRPASFVDLAPTIVSLAGAPSAPYHQGVAFLGKPGAPRRYVFGFRGRIDERYDMVRTAFDGRYVYIRNYMPHKIYGQHISYMFETPTTRVWKQLYDEGKLNEAQKRFWETKPFEELYDTESDRDEVNNIAGKQPAVLQKMRKAVDDWILTTSDRGFLPEAELHMEGRAYDCAKVKAMADLAAARQPESLHKLTAGLRDADSAVRYWACLGHTMRGKSDGLTEVMRNDPSASVRAVAAEAVGRFGSDKEAAEAAGLLAGLGDMRRHGVYVAMLALNGLDAMTPQRRHGVLDKVRSLPAETNDIPARTRTYVARLLESILGK